MDAKFNLSKKKKVVTNPKMSFIESLYLPAIFNGMMITISHLFKRKATVQYPEETRPIADIYRGKHVLKRDENGAERCTACGLCALACPAEAITMVAAERKSDEKHFIVKKNMPKHTKLICCVVFIAVFAKRLVQKKRFS